MTGRQEAGRYGPLPGADRAGMTHFPEIARSGGPKVHSGRGPGEWFPERRGAACPSSSPTVRRHSPVRNALPTCGAAVAAPQGAEENGRRMTAPR